MKLLSRLMTLSPPSSHVADFQYRYVAQAADCRTLIALSRSQGADPRFFLPQPPLVTTQVRTDTSSVLALYLKLKIWDFTCCFLLCVCFVLFCQWRTFAFVSDRRPIKIPKDRLFQPPSGSWSNWNTVLVVSCPIVFMMPLTVLLSSFHLSQAWGQHKT